MAKVRKPPRKPTGTITGHSIDLTPGEDARLESLGQFKLPEDKNAAETVVLSKMLSVSASFLPPVDTFKKFPTDHGPDFILNMIDRSESFAELLEIAPLKRGGYETASRVRNLGDFIDHIVEQVKIKETKYRDKPFKPIYLVLYVSDERFSPDPTQTKAIRNALNSIHLSAFEALYLVLFAYDGCPTVVLMRPFKNEFSRNEMRRLRKGQMIVADRTTAEVLQTNWDGDRFDTTVRMYLPPGADMSAYKIGKTLTGQIPGVDIRPRFPGKNKPEK